MNSNRFYASWYRREGRDFYFVADCDGKLPQQSAPSWKRARDLAAKMNAEYARYREALADSAKAKAAQIDSAK